MNSSVIAKWRAEWYVPPPNKGIELTVKSACSSSQALGGYWR